MPGVTTVLSVLAKPGLIKWANDLGLKGIDSTKYTDRLAGVGTLAHAMILAHLKKEEVDTSEYSKADIDLAENAFLSYLNWEKGHRVEPELLEAPLVSEEFKFGGTPDFYGRVDGLLEVIDFKTSKAIYSEHLTQVCAYTDLLWNNDPHRLVESIRILQIGRDETEGFSEKVLLQGSETTLRKELFLRCLQIYNLQREIKALGEPK